jgi:hypothetical protein
MVLCPALERGFLAHRLAAHGLALCAEPWAPSLRPGKDRESSILSPVLGHYKKKKEETNDPELGDKKEESRK